MRDEPLGAVRRQDVAVLFADIVGFTRMAEHMTPKAVVTLLRQFHEQMTSPAGRGRGRHLAINDGALGIGDNRPTDVADLFRWMDTDVNSFFSE
jgi:class 3 adenylate cyclase